MTLHVQLKSPIATMDFSVTSNIIFVAVVAALCAAFLAVVIGVIVSGKRRPNAFDIIVRVLASIVLFASAVLYTASWLCRMTGDMYIDTAIPALIIRDTMRELPLQQLFVALGTMLGSNLMLGLLILSMVALICDCTIANKKKSAAPVVAKTPEERKRDAEIARIRRIADSAVQKSSNAASANGKQAVQAQKGGYGKEQADMQSSDEFDWRVGEPQRQQQEARPSFVGIKEQNKDGFADFDSFDGDDNYNKPERDDSDFYAEAEQDEIVNDGGEGIGVELDAPEEPRDVFDEHDEVEELKTADEAPSVNAEDADVAEDRSADVGEQPEIDNYVPQIRTIVREPKKAEKPAANKPTTAVAVKPRKSSQSAVKPSAKSATAVGGGKPSSAKRTSSSAAKKPSVAVETRAVKEDDVAVKPVSTRKPSAKPSVKTSGTTVTIAKSEPKKRAATSKYIITDRANAAELFGEYLRAKDEHDKDKLEASISTVILKK